MRCICCLSQRIINRPLGLVGKWCCLDCGLIFDIKGEGEDVRKNDIRHFESVDPHLEVARSKKWFYNRVLNDLSLKVRGEKSILDVGCGFGYFLELASQKGWQVSGIEIVNRAVRDAKAKVGNQNIFHGTLKEAKYPDDSFDAITLWDLLFHVQDPYEELRECHRVLKSKGVIGIRVRNVLFEKMIYRAYSVIKKMVPNFGLKEPHVFHRYCFSSNSIFQLLQRVGFSMIEITNSPLTKGNPYGYTDVRMLVEATKGFFDLTSRVAFFLSGGKWIFGPSLLVWAEKP